MPVQSLNPETSDTAKADLISAQALWYTAPGIAGIQTEQLPPLEAKKARLKMLWSGLSRGTERLIFNGKVPVSEYERMAGPLQEGVFPYPVKYGYCAVACVLEGPKNLMGQTVFCLHPHQDIFTAPIGMLTPLPENLPPRRAILAANMETALNGLWDSGAGPADHIVVVGAGTLGLLITMLAVQLPGAQVTVVDIDESRAKLVQDFGARFALPDQAPKGADVVFHTSASPDGFNTALASAGLEATIVELSWYGNTVVGAQLGGIFHSRRLKLISSQVGEVSPSRRPRWSHSRRITAALHLLQDARLDALITREVAFQDLPAALPELLNSGAAGLTSAVSYS